MTHDPQLVDAHADITWASAYLTDGDQAPRVLVLATMRAIRADLPVIDVLVSTRQAGLGFLSVEAAKVQNDLARTERKDRIRHAQDGVTPTRWRGGCAS